MLQTCAHNIMAHRSHVGCASNTNNAESEGPDRHNLLQNFCYHRATLDSFARHWETGAPLPQDLFERLVAARTFRH